MDVDLVDVLATRPAHTSAASAPTFRVVAQSYTHDEGHEGHATRAPPSLPPSPPLPLEAEGPVKSRAASPDPDRPTIALLAPETKADMQAKRPLEWDPLSLQEIETATAIRGWLGEEAFAACPADLLITFIRGYAYRSDAPRAACAYLEQSLRWRQGAGVDSTILLGEAPPRLAACDRLCVSGPVGEDRHGRLVVYDAFCRAPVSELLDAFEDDDDFVRHMVYRREALRAANYSRSKRMGKRVYKVISIVDLQGLGLSHLDKRFYARFKRFSSDFGAYYPETTLKTIIINAPRAFTLFWAALRPFVHPITAAKVAVAGSNYSAALREAGVTLDGGVDQIIGSPPTWSSVLAALRAEHGPSELATGNLLLAEERAALSHG